MVLIIALIILLAIWRIKMSSPPPKILASMENGVSLENLIGSPKSISRLMTYYYQLNMAQRR